jgi:hypothetical protein
MCATAWGSDEDKDLMQRATMAVVREQHRREARKAEAVHQAAEARVAANAQEQAEAEAEAACMSAVENVVAEDAAWCVHWANALAEGQARQAAEEVPWVVREDERRAFTVELSRSECGCLCRLRLRDMWGPGRGGAGPFDS